MTRQGQEICRGSRSEGRHFLRGPKAVFLVVGFVLLICGLSEAPPALAHKPMASRLVHIQFQQDSVLVAVLTFLHPGTLSARIRKRFDRSGDSRLDEAEREALVEWMDKRARERLRVSLNGDLLSPRLSEREVKEEDEGVALHEGRGLIMRSVHRVDLQLRPGRHRLSIFDAPSGASGMVPLRLDLPPGVHLLSSSAKGGAAPLGKAASGPLQGGFAGAGGEVFVSIQVPEAIAEGEDSPEQGLGSEAK